MEKKEVKFKEYVRFKLAREVVEGMLSKAIEGHGEFDYNTSNNTFSISLNDNASVEEIKNLAVSLLQTMGATAYELSIMLDWKPFEK